MTAEEYKLIAFLLGETERVEKPRAHRRTRAIRRRTKRTRLKANARRVKSAAA